MTMKSKTLSRFLIAGALIGLQACAGNPIAKFFDKPYFDKPPVQLAKSDKDLFEKALSRQIYNRVPSAIETWNQFIEKHPGSFEAHNNLGLVYFEDDQVDQSIIAFEKALALEPNDAKIKANLAKVLKFKATLLKEEKKYTGAVDALLRAQDVSEGYPKERIGYVIEQYEDKVFEQAKQANTIFAYEGFLKRFPNSTKNADEARRKIEGMKPVSTEMLESASAMESKTEVPEMKEPQMEEMEEKEVVAMDAETPSSMVESVDEKAGEATSMMEQEDSMAQDSLMESVTSPRMEDGEAMMTEAAEKIPEMGELPEENLAARSQLPEPPQEIARGVERQVEIATQPEPKPSSAPDIFPVPQPKDTGSIFDELAQKPPSVKKMVEITTRKDPLRVRNGPSAKSRILATLEKGSQVPLIQEENGWYNVEFSQGRMGWVSKKYSRLME